MALWTVKRILPKIEKRFGQEHFRRNAIIKKRSSHDVNTFKAETLLLILSKIIKREAVEKKSANLRFSTKMGKFSEKNALVAIFKSKCKVLAF